ncbi:hypothetical protein DZA52_05425 [Vibrio campbellii]|nr:hypothetical protein DZA52_05425 [Vibrio campbellii]
MPKSEKIEATNSLFLLLPLKRKVETVLGLPQLPPFKSGSFEIKLGRSLLLPFLRGGWEGLTSNTTKAATALRHDCSNYLNKFNDKTYLFSS